MITKYFKWTKLPYQKTLKGAMDQKTRYRPIYMLPTRDSLPM